MSCFDVLNAFKIQLFNMLFYRIESFYYSCFLCIFANQTKIEVIYE